MTANQESGPESRSTEGNSLVFVSHDSRDADIAEAFSKLLGSVSAGVLKSFRSSDKKGAQGIDYGVEWYPTIMEKLEEAADVVCLLTPYSVNRPWILYEAGVAKGKLKTPVHGLALGIPLSEASSGPFAQFQNSDDDEDSLASLVMQLVTRIPGADPDREVVLHQVASFKEKVDGILESQGHEVEQPAAVDNSSIAKLFEEIKVMYRDLPDRIESSHTEEWQSRKDFQPLMAMRILHEFVMTGPELKGSPFLGVMIVAGKLRQEVPWLYDLSYKIWDADERGDNKEFERAGNQLLRIMDTLSSHWIGEELLGGSRETIRLIHELRMLMKELMRIRSEIRREKRNLLIPDELLKNSTGEDEVP